MEPLPLKLRGLGKVVADVKYFVNSGVFTPSSDLFCFNFWESTTSFSFIIFLNFFCNKCSFSGNDVILCNDVSRINFNHLKIVLSKFCCFQVYQSKWLVA